MTNDQMENGAVVSAPHSNGIYSIVAWVLVLAILASGAYYTYVRYELSVTKKELASLTENPAPLHYSEPDRAALDRLFEQAAVMPDAKPRHRSSR